MNFHYKKKITFSINKAFFVHKKSKEYVVFKNYNSKIYIKLISMKNIINFSRYFIAKSIFCSKTDFTEIRLRFYNI